MRVTELSGAPADPDCLHCYLAPVIEAWAREHAGKPPVHVILEVAQVLGELIGSEAFSSGHSTCVPNIVNGAMRETLRTALDLVNTLKRETRMKMQPVTSSNIKAVGYEDAELRIEFVNGRTYAYTGSTAEHHHHEIMKAESAGRYFSQHIRNDPELTTRAL